MINELNDQLVKLSASCDVTNKPTVWMEEAFQEMVAPFLRDHEAKDCVVSIPDDEQAIYISFNHEDEEHVTQLHVISIKHNCFKDGPESVDFHFDGRYM